VTGRKPSARLCTSIIGFGPPGSSSTTAAASKLSFSSSANNARSSLRKGPFSCKQPCQRQKYVRHCLTLPSLVDCFRHKWGSEADTGARRAWEEKHTATSAESWQGQQGRAWQGRAWGAATKSNVCAYWLGLRCLDGLRC